MDRTVQIMNVDKENHILKHGHKNKEETVIKAPIAPRKRLTDISNLPQQKQDAKAKALSLTNKEYIEKLQQENVALVKLLADRNKIIELSAIELQKLTINFQKVQQQNQQLASANSQILAELNSGKDRIKALQHELGCKSGVLIAMKLKSEGKANNRDCRNYERKECNVELMEDESHEEISQAEKVCATNVKPVHKEEVTIQRSFTSRRSTRLQSTKLEPDEGMIDKTDNSNPSVLEPVPIEKVPKKRLSSRRQSTRLTKSQETEATDDAFLRKDDTLPLSILHDNPIPESSMPLSSSSEKTKSEPSDSVHGSELQEPRRASMRPKRQAAEKVLSYKEIPVNLKMRRNE